MLQLIFSTSVQKGPRPEEERTLNYKKDKGFYVWKETAQPQTNKPRLHVPILYSFPKLVKHEKKY